MSVFEFELQTPTTNKNRKGNKCSRTNFPFLNHLMVLNPRPRDANKKYWREQVLKAIADVPKPEQPFEPWYAFYTWYVPFSMDASNVAAGMKHIEDTMKEFGIIVDDNLTHTGRILIDTCPCYVAPIHQIIKSKSSEKKVIVRYSNYPFFSLKSVQP